jgi:hypothetical protein
VGQVKHGSCTASLDCAYLSSELDFNCQVQESANLLSVTLPLAKRDASCRDGYPERERSIVHPMCGSRLPARETKAHCNRLNRGNL